MSNPLLPEANRRGGLASPWAGDDQDWWDWYVSLAHNPRTRPTPAPGPPANRVAPASRNEVIAALAEPYPLRSEDRERFERDGFVKLAGVLTPSVVAALAVRLDHLLRATFGRETAGRFLSLEQMWLTDPLMRALGLSRRLGDLAADLLGEHEVRLYHDTALSKEPGCGRTPWHCDADHFPMAGSSICTAWIPLHPVPETMGPLSFARGMGVGDDLGELPVDLTGTSYDVAVTDRLAELAVDVEAGPFALGEVSFHSARCFHSAGGNGTVAARRVLSTIYVADGVRVIDEPTLMSGTWSDFVPGVAPGGLVASEHNPIVGRAPRH